MTFPRSLGLTGAPNARDLGGLRTADGRTVRAGLVFRSPALGRLTDADVAALARLGLTDLLDLRHGSEIEAAPPDRLPAGPHVAHIPIFDPVHPVFTYVSAVLADIPPPGAGTSGSHSARGPGSAPDLGPAPRRRPGRRPDSGPGDDPAAGPGQDASRYAELAVRGTPEAMLAIYRWFVTAPAARAGFGTAMRRVAAATGPVLFHCSAGKDRTGWLSALLLGALGADRTTIEADYLLTNEANAAVVARILAAVAARTGVPVEVLRPVLDAAPRYLAVAFSQAETDFGGLDGYLRKGLGLGGDELAALRARLLE